MGKLTKRYRTYFDKNNTIVTSAKVNTARNPISELFMGTDIFSRYLFHCDFSEIESKVDTGDLTINKLTHKLHIKNTSNFDVSQFTRDGDIDFSDDYRSTSIDLELHAIGEAWDSGTGYDFVANPLNREEERDFIEEASNWFNRTQLATWSTAGGISTGSTAIATQHLETGTEDIEIDITDTVNGILTGDTNHGFMLKYASDYEALTGETNYVLGLFAKDTNTFFEPYIETIQDITIYDDRANFYLGRANKLYLYSYIGGNLTDLDETPECTIGTCEYVPVRECKGIYYITVPVSGSTGFTADTQYQDTWSNLKYNGVTLSDVELDFTTKATTEFFKLGLGDNKDETYGISVSGVKLDERLKQGEIKTIRVNIRKPYTSNVIDEHYQVYYTIYIKQGPNRITVIDWENVDRLFSGFEFTLDTTWMIPQQYFMDIKVVTNNDTRIFNEKGKYSIVSEF